MVGEKEPGIHCLHKKSCDEIIVYTITLLYARYIQSLYCMHVIYNHFTVCTLYTITLLYACYILSLYCMHIFSIND